MRDQKAVNLGVAQLIPGNAGDASGGKVEGDPEKGRKRDSRNQTEMAAKEGEQESEEPEVEAQHGAEEEDDAGGAKGRDVAVQQHGLIDPVAVQDVPEESTEIAGDGGVAKIIRMSRRTLVEERDQQRNQGDPGNEAVPGRHGASDGKAEIEEDGGDKAEEDGNRQSER